jgi:hypothetical protein
LKRVNVKGISGSGKTTFALELARRLDLPYVELDALHHGPNWSEPTNEEFRARVLSAMEAAPDGWVIDGNYEGKLGETVLAGGGHDRLARPPLPRQGSPVAVADDAPDPEQGRAVGQP